MPVAGTWISSTQSTTDGTTYTFSAQPIGGPASDRYVVVAVNGRIAGAAALTVSVTFDGVPMTLCVDDTRQAANTGHGSLWITSSPVTTGTTGTIVVTFNQTMARCGIGIYRLRGIASPTPFHTAINAGPLSSSLPNAAINVPAGGYAIACSLSVNALTTWTGLNERYDTTIEVSQHTGASRFFASAVTGHAVGTNSASSTEKPLPVASWSPAASDAYASEILVDDPFFYAPFEDSPGTTESLTQIGLSNVTAGGGAVFDGSCVTLDGVNDFLQTAAAVNYRLQNRVILAGWLYVTAYTNGGGSAWEGGVNGSNNNQFRFQPDATTGDEVVFHKTATGAQEARYSRWAAGQWVYVATEHDYTQSGVAPNEVHLWVNGVLQSSTSRPNQTDIGSSAVFATDVLNLGSRNGGASNFLAAKFKRFAIFPASFDTARLASHYTAGSGGPPPSVARPATFLGSSIF